MTVHRESFEECYKRDEYEWFVRAFGRGLTLATSARVYDLSTLLAGTNGG